MNIPASLEITNIPNLNIIVMKKRGGHFFISTKDSIVIDTSGLSAIMEYLVNNDMFPLEELERIINERKQNRQT